MTSEELHALGRRAVACKGWRWLGGMKVLDSFRVVESVVPMMFPVDTPDLADPATLGCLLALVREAYCDLMMQTRYFNGEERWCMCSAGESVLVNGRYSWGDSEPESLVRALEAAP